MLRLFGVVHSLGRIAANLFRQQIGEVGHFDALRLFAPMQHARLMLHARPFKRSFIAVYVEAFDVLASRFEQAAGHLGAKF